MHLRRTLHLVLVALAAAGAGCAAEVGEGILELGTGEWRYEPLEDGQEVPIIHGAQGGYHVWVSARALGVDGERVHMLLETEPMDASRPPEQSTVDIRLDETTDGSGMRQLIGWPAILAHPGCDEGRMLRIHLELSSDSAHAADEMIVIPRSTDLPPC